MSHPPFPPDLSLLIIFGTFPYRVSNKSEFRIPLSKSVTSFDLLRSCPFFRLGFSR